MQLWIEEQRDKDRPGCLPRRDIEILPPGLATHGPWQIAPRGGKTRLRLKDGAATTGAS